MDLKEYYKLVELCLNEDCQQSSNTAVDIDNLISHNKEKIENLTIAREFMYANECTSVEQATDLVESFISTLNDPNGIIN